MDKTLLKNSWILAGLLLVINVIFGLITFVVVEFFNIGSSGIPVLLANMAGVILVGQIYTINFKEIMPKKLRINVIIKYILAQMVLGSLYIFTLGLDVPIHLLLVGIFIGFYSLFMYWMLGSGGKMYLKALQKREAIKK